MIRLFEIRTHGLQSSMLQPTQLGIIATSLHQYLGRMVMQDKGAPLKAQMWQFKV